MLAGIVEKEGKWKKNRMLQKVNFCDVLLSPMLFICSYRPCALKQFCFYNLLLLKPSISFGAILTSWYHQSLLKLSTDWSTLEHLGIWNQSFASARFCHNLCKLYKKPPNLIRPSAKDRTFVQVQRTKSAGSPAVNLTTAFAKNTVINVRSKLFVLSTPIRLAADKLWLLIGYIECLFQCWGRILVIEIILTLRCNYSNFVHNSRAGLKSLFTTTQHISNEAYAIKLYSKLQIR